MPMRKLILALAALFSLTATIAAQVPPPVPALPDSQRITSYSLSGGTCGCSVGFAIYGDSTDVDEWIQVWIGGVQYLSTDPSHGWALSSATGPLATIPRPITDAVLTFNSGQTGTLQIVGARRPRRTTQFQEGRGVAARDLNQALTDIIAQNRENWDLQYTELRGLPGEVLQSMPSASSRAGKFLMFDATGLIPQVAGGSPGTGTVIGPATSTVGHLATWANTTGTLLADAAPLTALGNINPFTVLGNNGSTAAPPAQIPARIQLTNSQNFFVNGNSGSTAACGPTGASTCSAGSDSNNCLTPATACLTVQHVVNLVIFNYDAAGFQIAIYLAHNTGTTNYSFTCTEGPLVGQSVFSVQGDSNALTAVVIQAPNSSPAVQVKDGCTVGIDNLAFADSAGHNATSFISTGVGQYGHIDASGVSFGSLTAGTFAVASYAGSIAFIGSNNTITGGANAAFSVANGGVIDFEGTFAGSSSLTFNVAFAVMQSSGTFSSISGSTFTGFSGIAGPRCFIVTSTASPDATNPNSVFPGSTDCVIQYSAGAIGLQTGSGGSSSISYGTSGQFLTSSGPGSPDTWSNIASHLSAGNGISITGTTTATVATSLSTANNKLGADVLLNNTGTYFDGPSMAQGTSGTWYVSGTVTLSTSTSDSFRCKLWDGTTVISSTGQPLASGANDTSVTLTGILASPAANIRISCRDISSTNGKIAANDTANGADSTIWGLRLQ